MFNKSKSNSRFKVIYKNGSSSGCKILVDKETGINYLYSWDRYSGGLTPLLDQNGSPVISTEKNE